MNLSLFDRIHILPNHGMQPRSTSTQTMTPCHASALRKYTCICNFARLHTGSTMECSRKMIWGYHFKLQLWMLPYVGNAEIPRSKEHSITLVLSRAFLCPVMNWIVIILQLRLIKISLAREAGSEGERAYFFRLQLRCPAQSKAIIIAGK